MCKFLQIDPGRRSVATEGLEGEVIVKAGGFMIAKTLVAQGIAKEDPLSPENPLIISAGPFAATNFPMPTDFRIDLWK